MMTVSSDGDSLVIALSDARYALRVMVDLRLPMRDWTTVATTLESMLEAFGSGDAEGFETALEELSVLMPSRDTQMIDLEESQPADPSRVPQPADVLEIATRLVHAIDAHDLPAQADAAKNPSADQ